MLRAWAPVIVLGVPLESSENPFLATPLARVEAEVAVRECRDDSATHDVEGRVGSLLSTFISRVVESLGGGLCISLSHRVEGRASPSGLYAALTVLVLHSLARFHGDTLAPYELVEAARLADPLEKPSGWFYVLDALRYSVATGKTVVYRNEEEYGEVAGRIEGIEYRETLRAGRQVLTREGLGPDPYNALVHLVGVSVLEAAVRVREGEGAGSLLGLARLLTAISSASWGLPDPGGRCSLSPGLPGEFEVVCWVE